jgi:DHA2 family multidrug resistance protein
MATATVGAALPATRPAAEQTQIQGSKIIITVIVMMAALMSVLDISIVNVALSDIRASFGTPLDQIAWVSTGYAMANVTVIPISGWFQRRYGFARYFGASVMLFTIASALCGAAWNLPSLVIFRIIQGVGGGAIIPTAQNILFGRYPTKEHGTAGALFGLGMITGPLMGPTLGGYLIDWFSWHWIFLINVPIGAVVALMSFRYIEEPGFKADMAPIDGKGIALLGTGMVSLQYVLEEGNRDGWFEDLRISFLAVVAGVSLITFVVHELEAEHPVVDFSIFKDRTYAASTALNFLIGTVLFGGSFLYSLYCGSIMHYHALDIGLLFLKGSWIQIFIMPMVGKLIGIIDSRILIAVGLIGNVYSLWLNSHLTAYADSHAMMMPILVRACSLGLCFVPLSVVALSNLSQRQRGSGSGLFNLTRELGGSIGLAWMSTYLTNHEKLFHTALASDVSAYDPITQQQLAAAKGALGARVYDAGMAALAALNLRISSQSLLRAFNQAFMTLGFFFLLSLLLVFFLKKQAQGAKIDPAAH